MVSQSRLYCSYLFRDGLLDRDYALVSASFICLKLLKKEHSFFCLSSRNATVFSFSNFSMSWNPNRSVLGRGHSLTLEFLKEFDLLMF